LTGINEPAYVPGAIHLSGRGRKVMKRSIAVAACALAFVAVPVGGATAGEVKGPPNTIDNTNTTGALDHARSACAASGLNDFDTHDPMGQMESQVQTAADSWKFYGLPKGAPGTLGLCRGNAGGEG
jgi:hypothetical protein